MVASAQKNLLEEKLKLITELRNAGIKVCKSAFGEQLTLGSSRF